MTGLPEVDLQRLRISQDGSHHLLDGVPLYDRRFLDVQSFHEPGIAAVKDSTGAFHIDLGGEETYRQRYLAAYGYYYGKAAVDGGGWFHIDPNGKPAYLTKYAWVGNYQESVCVVRDMDGKYFHIDLGGSPLYDKRFRYVGDYKNGIAAAYFEDGSATHIDLKGNEVHGHHYEELGVYHKGFATAKDRWGRFHIDREGNPAYGRRLDWVEPFYNGQALASERGRLLVIDSQGRDMVAVSEDFSDYRQNGARVEIMDDLVGYWRTQILHSAVDLGVFDELDTHASGTKDLARSCGLPINSMELLARVLMAWGYVQKSNEGLSLTQKGKMLTEASPLSLKYAALMWGEEHYRVMGNLTESLRSGRPCFEAMYGSPFFDHIERDHRFGEVYRRAMGEYSTDYTGILQRLDLTGTKVIMDLGGGSGCLLTKILKANSDIERAILFDLPEVVNSVSTEPSEDLRFISMGGDFFVDELPRADTIVLSRVLHDWDDAIAERLLKRAFDAIAPEGRLIILDMVVPEDCAFDFGASLSLNLLVMVGGKERTFREFISLATGAGFKRIELVVGDDLISAVVCEM